MVVKIRFFLQKYNFIQTGRIFVNFFENVEYVIQKL
jgi:hypothetical protein